MTDVEELLRRTLHDESRAVVAEPSVIDGYRDRALRIRRTHRAVAVASVAATVAAITGGVIVLRPEALPTGSSLATGAPTPVGDAISQTVVAAVPNAVDVFFGTATRACGNCTPQASVLAADGSTRTVDLAATAPTAFPGDLPGHLPAGMRPIGLSVQNSGNANNPPSVWTWATDGKTSALTQYPLTAPDSWRMVSVPGAVQQAVLVDGVLWIASDLGVSKLDRGADQVTAISAQPAFSIAVDMTHNEVVVGQDPDVVAYDLTTGREKMRGRVHLGKLSVAVSGNGNVWAAGYDMAGPVDHKVVHLDGLSLQPIGTTPLDAQIGPGAQVWQGETVVWVENNGEDVTCVDASTGAVLSQGLAGNSKVGSTSFGAWRVADGQLSKLTLPASCPG